VGLVLQAGGVIGLTKDAIAPIVGASSDVGKIGGNVVNHVVV